jgi:hypothetical protein
VKGVEAARQLSEFAHILALDGIIERSRYPSVVRYLECNTGNLLPIKGGYFILGCTS